MPLARAFLRDLLRSPKQESLLAGYDKLINSTISGFIATKVSDQLVSSPAAVSDSSDPVRVILPFKDQSSADIVRRQLPDLNHKIHNLLFLTYYYTLHIYMLVFFNFFTYLKMTVDRTKRRFMSVIFAVLSFKKPLLIRHSPSILYCNSYHKFSNICKLEKRLVWPAEIVL